MAWPPISLRLWKRENISKEMAKEETPKVFWSDRLENLAERLAQLYDDYLGSRYRMLVNWERGLLPEGAGRWQAPLYRKLLTECPEAYTRDFDVALSETRMPPPFSSAPTKGSYTSLAPLAQEMSNDEHDFA